MNNIKRIVIVGTMACVITVIPGISGHISATVYAAAAAPTGLSSLDKTKPSDSDRLTETLGLNSDKELYDALLDGQSLAEIAAAHHKEVDPAIAMQTEQLQQQLTRRYADGQLSEAAYRQQMAEAAEIISASAHRPYKILG
ncbi:hypothetical protein V3851_11315 [Paenibacillus sp. M1]|uniref:SHOCT domain-containing protein n=1 Tax=Paenibacillus haidiansis TaxID=1574488 RepID=A0ABU7VU21_9BACL